MNIGILIFPQVEELDFVGPWELFSLWQRLENGPERCLVVAETLDPVVAAKGLSLNPHASFSTCPPLDVLLVPGGQGTRKEVFNTALVDFIRDQAEGAGAVLSVCTGAFLLHAAGLLEGRRATTHWGSLDRLRALGDVEVVEERTTQDGPIWTSAGVSAGLDLALAFIAERAGEEAAAEVQLAAEYFPSDIVYGTPSRHPKAPAYLRRS
ncbi:DJ-1/PfpI family protein [Cyanobium sp. Morenito 9A2]|uniref:DJ-1/PfpI family protein n=1 Tax=Cyanobium sp. Morenito 9A2 TaxID=2823718 RepID=UPI0020CE47F7|nr:DJ-1/PfpI family protein [Cyanobium sp. Morenito 9A2]MCP9849810.1 DJ-1/PfpI family protein [Cyanobium sp. Morenito 9A2]